ncbi:MAG: helix-turn-helix domain-containing protein [Candidatus Thiodiazotropha sp. (ex Notomyrtea botanica)]|nr:helix-turn-helix domain-containing protein [Candidatus Thiodiazotropha sp. (ex Notomyrtea botanica)]
MKTIEYIDKAKKSLGISSDYAFAKWLGVGRNAVSNYRNNIRTINDATAVKIADVLKIDPIEIIAQANLEREKNPENKKFWKDFLSRVAGLVIALPAGIEVLQRCILC